MTKKQLSHNAAVFLMSFSAIRMAIEDRREAWQLTKQYMFDDSTYQKVLRELLENDDLAPLVKEVAV